MNDQTHELQRQMEAATALGDASEESLDAEMSSLRQGWLGLGQLLDAAEAAMPEPSGRWQVPRPRIDRQKRSAKVAVLAASLLIGAAIAWLVLRPQTAGVQPAAPGSLASQQKTPGPVVPDGKQGRQRQEAPLPASDLKWDDSLDEQLASAAQAVINAEETWNDSPGATDYIRYGLKQVEEDFNKNNL